MTSSDSQQIPDMMRAAISRRPGRRLTVESISTPRPQRGEVLVRVEACGVCHSDLHVLDDAIPFPRPAVLGHEVSGAVVEIGPDSVRSEIAVGQRVAGAFLMPCGQCEHCVVGRDDLCGPFFDKNRAFGQLYDGTSRLQETNGEPIAMYSMGGLAEYAVLPVTSVAPLPEGVEGVAGAILGCAGLTAYGAVRRAADLRFGETVAIVAVGGVGSNIVQIARTMGATQVIAIDIDDDKLAAAERLGATLTINSRTEDVRQAVMQATHGRGVDVAFEVLGIPRTFELALTLLSAGGRMVPVGLGSTGSTAPVEINLMVRRSLRIIGNYGARTRADLPAVIKLADEGGLRYQDVVTQVFDLDEVNEAYDQLRAGTITGRAVIKIERRQSGVPQLVGMRIGEFPSDG